jgi:hypothetical protein
MKVITMFAVSLFLFSAPAFSESVESPFLDGTEPFFDGEEAPPIDGQESCYLAPAKDWCQCECKHKDGVYKMNYPIWFVAVKPSSNDPHFDFEVLNQPANAEDVMKCSGRNGKLCVGFLNNSPTLKVTDGELLNCVIASKTTTP